MPYTVKSLSIFESDVLFGKVVSVDHMTGRGDKIWLAYLSLKVSGAVSLLAQTRGSFFGRRDKVTQVGG